MAAFDLIASQYDSDFTFSEIGKAQREQVWKAMPSITKTTYCLELNCGTGHDAELIANFGATILATDVSTEMIQEAKIKLEPFADATTQVLDITELNTIDISVYNLVFSNFGGLNCLSPQNWNAFAENLQQLPTGSKLAFVIMGRKCIWESLYFRTKKNKKWDRTSLDAFDAKLGSSTVKTWYYSPNEIIDCLKKGFNLTKCQPIGLFVPPSYLESWFVNKSLLFSLLKTLDRWFFNSKKWANYSDHFYIEFVKS